MEAKVKLGPCVFRIVLGGFLGLVPMLGLAASAHAQVMQTQKAQVEWSSEGYNLRFLYPGDFVRRDPEEALKDGHLMVFGVPGRQVPEIAEATKCLKPLLSLEIPTSGGEGDPTRTKNADGSITVTVHQALLGTILLAELDIDCLTPAQKASAVQDSPTKLVSLMPKVPGMHVRMQPTFYLIDKQKIFVAAAQGLPKMSEDADAAAEPLLSFTMGFSTAWSNHLLVWYFSSNSAQTLNRMTKSVVQFGNAKPAPIYPVTVGYRDR